MYILFFVTLSSYKTNKTLENVVSTFQKTTETFVFLTWSFISIYSPY